MMDTLLFSEAIVSKNNNFIVGDSITICDSRRGDASSIIIYPLDFKDGGGRLRMKAE